jgi:soluble lytic murein transglycosylase-like protein
MQFMPATAAGLGVNPLDPASAVDGAARMLTGLYRQFGRWDYALAAYNAGRRERCALRAASRPTPRPRLRDRRDGLARQYGG